VRECAANIAFTAEAAGSDPVEKEFTLARR
jgi:hypothetical protein